MESSFVTLLLGNNFLQLLLEHLFSSMLGLGLLMVLIPWIRPGISAAGAHRLWLAGLLAVTAIPFVESGLLALSADWSMANQFQLTVLPGTAAQAGPEAVNQIFIADLLVMAYGLVAFVLFAKFIVTLIQLRRLDASATPVTEGALLQTCQRLLSDLRIQRQVSIKQTDAINSPVSYGFINPTILIPEAADKWSSSLNESVLIHELSHLKRFDWLKLLFTRLLTCLLWANPLVWIAARKLHEEAEQACDASIVGMTNNRVGYAESLLALVRKQKGLEQQPVLAQAMLEKHGLNARIHNILEGKLAQASAGNALISMLAIILFLTILGGSVNLVSAQDDQFDQDYLPVEAVAPLYPTRAAEEGIEGWILVSFTVLTDGSVDAGSLSVIDAEPAGYFERSATRAAEQFRFEPRISGGEPVEVPGVQYLFRYQLEDGGYQTEPLRPAPPARY